MLARASIALPLLVASCAAPPTPTTATLSRRPTTASPSPAEATRPAPAPAAAPVPAPVPVAAPAPVHLLAFTRVLEAPLHSVALGNRRVGALGEDVWVDDDKGLRKLQRPRANLSDVAVFFGRDDQPRLMGFEHDAELTRSVYLRWRGGQWEKAASEIGRLGSGAPAALYGVLGDADPEVVCKVGESCIIKRRTGWTTLTAPDGLYHVVLAAAVPWAYREGTLLRLEKAGWRALEGVPFHAASGLFAFSDSNVWVSEASANALHHFDGHAWTTTPSPLTSPRGLWGSAPDDLWLVGENGAAHFDGHDFRRVEGASESLAVVTGRSAKDVWLAGASGLWHGTA